MTDCNEYVGDDGYTYVTRRVEWRVQSVEVDQYGQNPKAYAESAFPTRAAAEEYRAKIAKPHDFVSRWVPNDATHSYVECLITRVEVVVPDALLAAEKRGEERERERAALIALNYTFTEEGVRHSNMAVAINASLAIRRRHTQGVRMKPIARTAAQKLEAKRLARLREPNGRLSRKREAKEARQDETERAVKETVTEARMRVLGLSAADCERPEAGSVLGRLYLDARNKLTKAQYEAGVRMGEDFARYYALTGIPFPAASAIDLTRVHGIGRDPNPAAVRAASNAVMAIEAALGMADESGRPVTSVCKAVCIRDEPIYHGHMIEFLKRGLVALVEHYGVGGN